MVNEYFVNHKKSLHCKVLTDVYNTLCKCNKHKLSDKTNNDLFLYLTKPQLFDNIIQMFVWDPPGCHSPDT